MPVNRGNSGRKWFICDRSGWDFPEDRMVREGGFRVGDIFADDPGRQLDPDPRQDTQERELPDDGL